MRKTAILPKSEEGLIIDFRKNESMPIAETIGVTINGRTIHHGPHSGFGSSAEKTKSVIKTSPIAQPESRCRTILFFRIELIPVISDFILDEVLVYYLINAETLICCKQESFSLLLQILNQDQVLLEV